LVDHPIVHINSKNELAFSIGNSLYSGTVKGELPSIEDTDISQVIIARAIKGYGVNPEKNITLKHLCTKGVTELWSYFKLADKGITELTNSLADHQPATKEEIKHQIFPIHKTKIRDIILTYCGWIPDIGNRNDLFNDIDGYRRLALAAFHLDFSAADAIAVKLMNEGNKSTQLVVIRGLIKDLLNNKKACSVDFFRDATDPYMQLLLAFISLYALANINSNKDTIKEVLHAGYISLLDRIGFIARFFDEEEIKEEVKLMLESTIEKGLIEGVIITGLTKEVWSLIIVGITSTPSLFRSYC